MAREVPFGLLLTAKDLQSPVLKKIAKATDDLGESIDETAEKTEKAETENFKLSEAITGLNQALELAKSAWEAVSLAMDLTVVKALEQRHETDKQAKDFRDLGIQLERIQGLLGDIVIPLILGVSDALGPVNDGMEKWLETNKELVGSKLVGFLATTSRILVGGVAVGVLQVSKAWSNWKQIVFSTEAAISGAFASMIDDGTKWLESFEKIARILKQEELADSIKAVRDDVSLLRDEFQDTSDTALAEAAAQVKAQKELEDQILKLVSSINTGIGRASVAAIRRLREAIKKVPPNIDEIREALEKLKAESIKTFNAMFELIMETTRAWGDAQESMADFNEGAFQLGEDLKAQQQEIADSIAESFSGAYDSIRTNAIEGFAEVGRLQNEIVIDIVRNEQGLLEEQERIVDQHVKTVGNAVSEMFEGFGVSALEAAEQFVVGKLVEMAASELAATLGIKAAAAEGSAKAVAAYAGIPFLGLGLGLAAAAAISAVILANVGTFHEGGTIPGQGEQLALVRGGEHVSTEDQRQAVADAFGFNGGGGGSGSTSQAQTQSQGGNSLTIIVQNLAPTDITEAEKQLEQTLLPLFKQWIRDLKLEVLPGGVS